MAMLGWPAALGHIQPTPEPTVPCGAAGSVAGSVGASVGAAASVAGSAVAGGGRASRSRDKRSARWKTVKGGGLCLVVMEQARRVAAAEDGAAWAVPTPLARAGTASARNADIRRRT